MAKINILSAVESGKLELINTKFSIKKSFKLLDFVNKVDKNKKEFYRGISFTPVDFKLESDMVDSLLRKNIVGIVSKKENLYSLTFKGILIVHYGIQEMDDNLNDMLNGFNDVYYDRIMKLSEQNLDAKEKAIVLTLFGLNALSENYCLKLTQKNSIYFKEAVDYAASFIKKLGPEFVDDQLGRLWDNDVVGEGPVLGEMRRTNKIPVRIEGIYKKTPGHYLDVLVSKKLDEVKVSYLLNKIFDKRSLTFEERKELIRTLDTIQQFEFRIFKEKPDFDTFEINKRRKYIIESQI